jgi:RNA polymerase sigma-70 factor (ECF subfamily)
MKIGRHFARSSSLRMDEVDRERIPDRLTDLLQQRAEQRELLAALRRAVDQELTEHPRRVFVADALNEVPMDAIMNELGTNRNAARGRRSRSTDVGRVPSGRST